MNVARKFLLPCCCKDKPAREYTHSTKKLKILAGGPLTPLTEWHLIFSFMDEEQCQQRSHRMMQSSKRFSPALTLIQKHIRLRDMAQLEDKLASLFVLGQLSGQQITALVNDLIQAGQARDVQKLLYGLAQRVPEHGEKFMTMAEQLKLIGRKEGIQEGKRTATQEMAKAMIERGLDSHIIMDITGFSQDELQKLTH